MPIHAKEKILKELYNKVDYENLSSDQKRKIDQKEIEKRKEKIFDDIRVAKECLEYNNCIVLHVEAEECWIGNGLILMEVIIQYQDIKSNNIHLKKQIMLTTPFYDKDLVKIDIETEAKAIQQLLITSLSKNTISPDILIESAKISINRGYNPWNHRFTTYTNINNGQLLVEKYRQGYPCTYSGNHTLETLLNLCGCYDRNLEILYDENRPVFAQLSNKYNVILARFNPNSQIDAQQMINIVNQEVYNIIIWIGNLVDQYENEYKGSPEKIYCKKK